MIPVAEARQRLENQERDINTLLPMPRWVFYLGIDANGARSMP